MPKHLISLKIILIPATEPIFGLAGLDPGSELVHNQQNPLTIGPFDNDLLAQEKVSPKVVWGVLEPIFHTLREN